MLCRIQVLASLDLLTFFDLWWLQMLLEGENDVPTAGFFYVAKQNDC